MTTLPLTPVSPIDLHAPTPTWRVFAAGVRHGLGRKQGVVPEGATFPAVVVRRRGVVVSAEAVARYRAVCGVPGPSARLPTTQPEACFLALMGRIVTHPRFPLSPFGLIHVGQRIVQHRPVASKVPMDLEARLDDVQDLPRGYELSVGMTVSQGGAVVWTGTATLLSRRPGARALARFARPTHIGGTPIVVPEHTGRAYAAVSGDYNPHHLTRWTAKPLGYDHPIAHGMWTMARLTGLLPESLEAGALALDVTFRRPILMPTAILADVRDVGAGTWRLDAFEPARRSPHVLGTAIVA